MDVLVPTLRNSRIIYNILVCCTYVRMYVCTDTKIAAAGKGTYA